MSQIPEHFFEGEDLSPKEAERRLLDACDSHEEDSYYRKLMPDEIIARKDEMTNLDIKFEDLAEAKKKAVAEFKGKMDPIALRKKAVLGEVRTGLVSEEGEVYTVLYPEERKAATFDATGRRIYVRDMTSAERQTSLRFDSSNMRAAV